MGSRDGKEEIVVERNLDSISAISITYPSKSSTRRNGEGCIDPSVQSKLDYERVRILGRQRQGPDRVSRSRRLVEAGSKADEVTNRATACRTLQSS
jgi:hypothetical protein